MERSRIPLEQWAAAIRFMSEPQGINAVQLASQAGLSYKAALSILKKIRHAISNFDRSRPLTFVINAGLAFYGRHYFHPSRLHPQEHPVLVGATIQDRNEPSYLKIKLVSPHHMDSKSLRREGLLSFCVEHAAFREVRLLSRAQFHLGNGLRQLFCQAKSWINHTFHGIGSASLQSYFDEFCFRLNTAHRRIPLDYALASLCAAPSRNIFTRWKKWGIHRFNDDLNLRSFAS